MIKTIKFAKGMYHTETQNHFTKDILIFLLKFNTITADIITEKQILPIVQIKSTFSKIYISLKGIQIDLK